MSLRPLRPCVLVIPLTPVQLVRLRSRRHARRFTARSRRRGQRAARGVRRRAVPEERIGRMVGDGAATLVARAFAASGIERAARRARSLPRDLRRPAAATTRVRIPACRSVLDALGARAALAVLTNKPLAATREILEGLDLARSFSGARGPRRRRPVSAQAGSRRAAASRRRAPAVRGDDADGRRLPVDWRTARDAGTRICLARYGFGFDSVPVAELGAGRPRHRRPR